jgi:uncharacterized membrane protein HdeD (DUF308 family)
LVASALLVIFTDGQAEFIGKSLFVMLLLPYFLSGIAQMHARARQSPAGNWWLALAYGLLILAIWPAIVFILLGVIRQLQFWFGAPPAQETR